MRSPGCGAIVFDFSDRSAILTKRSRTTVKLHYYPETDSLYIDLSERTSVDSREVASGVVLDFDAAGNLVGIDIDHASKVANLSRLEARSLPIRDLSLVGATS
jgi:uncharacterized protein YuzE